jgi:hypothetical protein
MTTAQHTPEPWEVDVQGSSIYLLGRADSEGQRWCIANIAPSKTGEGQARQVRDFRRIVACVNACVGILTEKLEEGIIESLQLDHARLMADLAHAREPQP